MNKDQVKGTAKDIAGKVQEGAGKVTGDREQEAKGLSKQVEGSAWTRPETSIVRRAGRANASNGLILLLFF